MLIGPDQYELAAIEPGGSREPQRLERNAARARRRLDGTGIVRCAEIEQREAIAELVTGGTSGREPDMRPACARPVERCVGVPGVGRRGRVVGPDDRRVFVTFAEL